VGGVLDRLQSGGDGTLHILLAVVDEEDAGGGAAEALDGALVDGGGGLDDAVLVRPCAVSEVRYPGMLVAQAGFHGVANVGEDAGADAALLQAVGPLHHGAVDLSPDLHVCGAQGVKFGCVQRKHGLLCDELPVGFAGQFATVIFVAVQPVAVVEAFFAGPGQSA